MRLGILSTWLVVPLLALCTLAPAQSARAYLPSPDEFPGIEKGSYLGIDPGEVTSDNAAALKLKEEMGVEVRMVDQDAPAGKAGLKEHDVILNFNGQKVESVQQLRRMLAETPGGRTVKLGISRNGQYMDIPVALTSRKKMREEWQVGRIPPVPAVPAVPMVAPAPPNGMPGDWDFPANVNVLVQTTSRNGLMIESLTPQLAEYFGVKRGEGVLVRGVERGSPAAQAGLRAGDVIVSVDKEQISDVSDWRRVMRRKSGNVSVGIIREKRQQSVPLKLPARTREQGEMIAPDHFTVGELDIDIDTDQLNEQLDLIKPQIEQQRHLIAMQLEAQRPQIEKALNEAKHIQGEELEKARKAIEKIDVEQIKREAEKSIDHAQLERDLAQMKSELAKIDVQKLKADFIDSKEFEKMQQEIQKQMKELQKDLRDQQEQFHMISY